MLNRPEKVGILTINRNSLIDVLQSTLEMLGMTCTVFLDGQSASTARAIEAAELDALITEPISSEYILAALLEVVREINQPHLAHWDAQWISFKGYNRFPN